MMEWTTFAFSEQILLQISCHFWDATFASADELPSINRHALFTNYFCHKKFLNKKSIIIWQLLSLLGSYLVIYGIDRSTLFYLEKWG